MVRDSATFYTNTKDTRMSRKSRTSSVSRKKRAPMLGALVFVEDRG